jgi:hypothetical protein
MCDFSLVLSGKEAELKISELYHKKQMFSPEKALLKQPKKFVSAKAPLESSIKKTVLPTRQSEVTLYQNPPAILIQKKGKSVKTEQKEEKESSYAKVNVPPQVTSLTPLLKKIEKPLSHKKPVLLQPTTNVLSKSSENNTNKPVSTHTKTHIQVVKESTPLKKFEQSTPKKITSIPQPKKKVSKALTKKINERSKGYINLQKSLQNQPKITQFFNKSDK